MLDYVSDRNAFAADRLNEAIAHAAEMLTSHPFMGRVGRISGTREWVAHPNYILIYKVGADAIDIVRVLHARQQYP